MLLRPIKVKLLFACALWATTAFVYSQQATTRKDSLLGGSRPERTCFDVLHYALDVKVDPDAKSISGSNSIDFQIVDDTRSIQLDLFANMRVDSIVMNRKTLQYRREEGAVFIEMGRKLKQNTRHNLLFYYSGNPFIAKKAPWDGGFVFDKSGSGKPWIGTAVQGVGASLWLPLKDTQADEPDQGIDVAITVPEGLTAVSNGRLLKSEPVAGGCTRWSWRVLNPINSYDISLNIGDYVHFSDIRQGIDLDYYVLRENEAKARRQFEEVKPMLDCFTAKFGRYPFWEDGYKLVEAPFLGMEHQSAVAYGNGYQKGYLGTDLSGTGKGLTFDFILVHESAHEWFGNSITSSDIADSWIHEGFACYAESVYLECYQGRAAAETYLNGLRKNIANDQPVIGPYGVNREGSTDRYYKAALMLNSIRNVLHDDGLWWAIMYKFATDCRLQIVDTPMVIDFFNRESGRDLTPIFKQYLYYKDLPVLEMRRNRGRLEYRWNAGNPDFNMPIEINSGTQVFLITPNTREWQTTSIIIGKNNDTYPRSDKYLFDIKK